MSKNVHEPEGGIITDVQAIEQVVSACAVDGTPELLSKALIKQAQNYARGALISLDQQLHAIAVQCLMHAAKHGDTSLMKRFMIDTIGEDTAYRRQLVIAWMRAFSPMELTAANGGNIKLTGTINGEPIPFDIERANLTPFWDLRKDDDDVVEWRPIFKDNVVGMIARSVKKFDTVLQNSKIDGGKIVGPVNPTKEYYQGYHIDKMKALMNKAEALLEEFQTFSDDSATRFGLAKQKAQIEANLNALDAQEEQIVATAEADKAEQPAPEPVE